MSELIWGYKYFDELSTEELYKILSLRNRVFVVEQNCIYNDTDGKDLSCFHLCGYVNNILVAYARIGPPGLFYPEPIIGRVVTDPAFRGKGFGKELMKEAIQFINRQFEAKYIKLSAQLYLVDFYEDLGFNQVGEGYLEDNIPHIEMIYPK